MTIVIDILLCGVFLDPFKSFVSGFKAATKTRTMLLNGFKIFDRKFDA